MKTFQFFGCEDSIHNHLQMLLLIKREKINQVQKQGKSALNSRQFTTECLQMSQLLILDS
jgi:hypothetical protein